VFYDAESVQPWGRFLEVAPQAWGGTLYPCRSCGAAAGVTTQTSDGGADGGFFPCRNDDTGLLLSGEAGANGKAIGDGRRNTQLLQSPECVNGTQSAVALASGYRGLGLTDWYLPSQAELVKLCQYEGRNAIGGFRVGDYVSSTTEYYDYGGGMTRFYLVYFGDSSCTSDVTPDTGAKYARNYVRPIRAFS
jgi:hypothetical protein